MNRFLKYISIAVVISFVTALGIGLLPLTAQAACGNSYLFCQQVTIDHTQAGTADSTNWPGEASTTQASLATVANGGHIQNTVTQTGTSSLTVPADFIVTSDSGCTTLLSWEFEKYIPTTGQMIFFFNWGTLSHTTDGHPWICYDKVSATTWQGSLNGTWNTNYKDVYHFNESSMNIGQFSYDSTASNNNEEYNGQGGGTATATPISGQIDGATLLASTSEFTGASASSTFVTGTGTGNITMEGWFNFNSAHTHGAGINDPLQIDNGSGLQFLSLMTNSGNTNVAAKWEYFAGGFQTNTTTAFSISTGTWYYFDITSDNSTLSFYINNSLVGSVAMGQARNGDGRIWLSWNPLEQRTDDIKFDEVRFSNTILSTSQITADYNNQKTGSTMVTFGSEQSGGGGATPGTPAFIQFGLLTIDDKI